VLHVAAHPELAVGTAVYSTCLPSPRPTHSPAVGLAGTAAACQAQPAADRGGGGGEDGHCGGPGAADGLPGDNHHSVSLVATGKSERSETELTVN